MRFTGYCGSAITYDAIGNTLSYRDYTLTWSRRKLESLSKLGLNVAYKYDSDGIRTSKTVNGIKYTYYYEGSTLRFEQRGNEKLYYSYNGYGHLSGITYIDSKGVTAHYYVMTNTRGDVEQIYNARGTLVAQYMYDAWGNVLAVKDGNGAVLSGSANHIGNINPIRYRGYYYDVETKLYYLNSRYYDPEVGRFISADGVVSGAGGSVQGYNLFSYCMNNPVNMSDESGCWPKFVENAKKWINDNVIKPAKAKIDKVVSDIKKDSENYNKNNKDISTVYNSHYFSSYKGTLVIRHSSEFLTSWAIGGTIFLNHSEDQLSYREQNENLNHEYGHILQEEELGISKYIVTVAVPSVTYNFISRENDFLENIYYDMPWEYNADLRGGVNRGYYSFSGKLSKLYFDLWEVLM